MQPVRMTKSITFVKVWVAELINFLWPLLNPGSMFCLEDMTGNIANHATDSDNICKYLKEHHSQSRDFTPEGTVMRLQL